MKKLAVLSLSGGMDSTCLLLHLLREGYQVKLVSFNYGQKHSIELERAIHLVAYLRGEGKDVVSHNILDLNLGGLLDSALIKGGADIPEGHYEESSMKATVVPNRNKIFSSIIQAVALSWANKENCSVKIAMGIHSGDHAIYPDCRQEFRDADYNAFLVGNWYAEKVKYYLPYLMGTKTTILQDALVSCEALRVDFDECLKRTNTSYNPTVDGKSSGTSGADIERIEAFININRKDPVEYVNGWEEAKAHAIKVLSLEG